MTENLSCYTIVTTLAIFLSGCVSHTEQKPAPVEEAKLGINHSIQSVQLVPNVPLLPSVPLWSEPIKKQNQNLQSEPRTHHYDWNSAMLSMVDKMLQAHSIIGSLLLVDNVNNQTNGSLNAWEATEKLRNALANSGKFTLVSVQELSVAKQQLGLSPQDSLNSRSKAISIARNVGAQYVLYSNTIGNVNSPFLQMQLMLVQTGEIIWSGRNTVIQF